MVLFLLPAFLCPVARDRSSETQGDFEHRLCRYPSPCRWSRLVSARYCLGRAIPLVISSGSRSPDQWCHLPCVLRPLRDLWQCQESNYPHAIFQRFPWVHLRGHHFRHNRVHPNGGVYYLAFPGDLHLRQHIIRLATDCVDVQHRQFCYMGRSYFHWPSLSSNQASPSSACGRNGLDDRIFGSHVHDQLQPPQRGGGFCIPGCFPSRVGRTLHRVDGAIHRLGARSGSGIW
jgi:hypothetical protein